MARQSLAAALKGGDRRSVGSSNRVATLVLREPKRFAELMECLWSEDAIVRMRAADAAEKASAKRPGLLEPFKAELLALLERTVQPELRWHLAQMVARVPLEEQERRRAAAALWRLLGDRSSIVKTSAIQGLAELSRGAPEMRQDVMDLLERAAREGTPAMRARSRILLAQFRKADGAAQ